LAGNERNPFNSDFQPAQAAIKRARPEIQLNLKETIFDRAINADFTGADLIAT